MSASARLFDKWKLLMALPHVVWLPEPQGVEILWQRQACLSSVSPKVWMDAYLAAFAAGHGIPLATLDKDFARFTGLAVRTCWSAANTQRPNRC